MAVSKSSRRWLAEHRDCQYVQAAARQGWRARSAYKLLEIQKKDRILQPGMQVLDLGAAPGGWSQVAAQCVQPTGRVIAVDCLPMEALPAVQVVQGDFTEQECFDRVLACLAGRTIDVLLSDMAPNFSGMAAVDQPRAMYLAELALDCARRCLRRKGTMVVKVFHGVGFDELFTEMRAHFEKVISRKPDASRQRSRELYLLAKGYRGN